MPLSRRIARLPFGRQLSRSRRVTALLSLASDRGIASESRRSAMDYLSGNLEIVESNERLEAGEAVIWDGDGVTQGRNGNGLRRAQRDIEHILANRFYAPFTMRSAESSCLPARFSAIHVYVPAWVAWTDPMLRMAPRPPRSTIEIPECGEIA